jgi:hypothetical protein
MPHDAIQPRPRVLCFSRDQSLLETRGAVLATRYQTVTVMSVEEIYALQPDIQFDVVVLCHSLSDTDCDVASAIARQWWPQAKILGLATSRSGCSTSADGVVQTADGPCALLRAVDSLIRPSIEATSAASA